MVADEHPAVHRTTLRGLHHAADRPCDAADQRHLHLPPAQKTTGHTLRRGRPPLQVRVVLLDSTGGRNVLGPFEISSLNFKSSAKTTGLSKNLRRSFEMSATLKLS
ncbi:hypothetical protein TNCT_327071 [Trichonephila clavata]|uniref:Uncharacterized protein n=1 Tax=Trichonephila clavata TaxID=2740835 RepID=A0A8X6IBA0_TRICU|nr:hypothetical protein TNCT_327071 [Trichonephila clavata]